MSSNRSPSYRVHKCSIRTLLMPLACVVCVVISDSCDTLATGSRNLISLGELVLKNDSTKRNITEGETLTLVYEENQNKCEELTFTWRKNDRSIAEDEVDTACEGTLSRSKYVLEGSQERGRVNISCRVFRYPSPDYIDSRSIVIDVLRTPQPDIKVPGGCDTECEVEEGGHFIFKCDDKKRYPESPVDIRWYHNGQLLEGKTKELLELEEVEWHDGGDYVCHMNNTVGGCDSSAKKLNVEHIPVCGEARPPDIYFSHDNQKRNITCGSVGNPPPNKYVWNCGKTDTESNENWLTVIYSNTSCQCKGINSFGTQKTPCIYHMKRKPPDRVSNCSVDCSVDKMQMLLACVYEPKNNSTVSFKIQIKNNGTVVYNANSTSSNFSFPRLKAYLELDVTVYAVNAFGNSSFNDLYNTTNCSGGHSDSVVSPYIKNTVIITVVFFIALIVAAAIYWRVRHSNNQRKPRSYGEEEDATPPLSELQRIT